MVTVGIPVQAAAGIVENPIERLARSRVRVKHKKTGKPRSRHGCAPRCGIRNRGCGTAELQVRIARQNAYVVGMLVKGMLPAPLANGAEQQKVTGMRVWIGVVRLVGILG